MDRNHARRVRSPSPYPPGGIWALHLPPPYPHPRRAVTCHSAPPRRSPRCRCGPRNYIILGRTPPIPLPSPSWLAPTPRDIRLASASASARRLPPLLRPDRRKDPTPARRLLRLPRLSSRESGVLSLFMALCL